MAGSLNKSVQRAIRKTLPDHIARDVAYRVSPAAVDFHAGETLKRMGIAAPQPLADDVQGLGPTVLGSPNRGQPVPVPATNNSYYSGTTHEPAVLPKGRRI